MHFVKTTELEETVNELRRLLYELIKPKVLIQTVTAGLFCVLIYIAIIYIGG